jgi:hypothetical protein
MTQGTLDFHKGLVFCIWTITQVSVGLFLKLVSLSFQESAPFQSIALMQMLYKLTMRGINETVALPIHNFHTMILLYGLCAHQKNKCKPHTSTAVI